MSGQALIAVNVGNSRTQAGLFQGDQLVESARFGNDRPAEVVDHVVALWRRMSGEPQAAIAMATVNEPFSDGLRSVLEDQLGVEVYRVGRDLPVPVGESLEPETITGVDRLLNAAAAFATIEQACIVIDAGTAVTVDFVDGEGVFHGGAIAPGVRMQLRALHRETAALPQVEFTSIPEDAFGRSTAAAMLQGVSRGVRGLVWKLVEQYSTEYGAYPQIVATGGDAEALFGHDELIDHIVPDLTLRGIAISARVALTQDRDNA